MLCTSFGIEHPFSSIRRHVTIGWMTHGSVQAERGSKCVIMLTTDTRHFHSALPKVEPLFLHLTIMPGISRDKKQHVGSASNRYGLKMNGLLAAGSSLHVGRQATNFSALHPSDNDWPDEGFTRAHLGLSFEINFLASKKLVHSPRRAGLLETCATSNARDHRDIRALAGTLQRRATSRTYLAESGSEVR